MGKLIMWNMVTLDGYFEGSKSWEIAWHTWGEELEDFSIEQLKSADALLFGRVTYLGMAQYWTSATGKVAQLMNGVPKVVFSTTLQNADWNNTRLVRQNAVPEVKLLKAGARKDVFIFGSAHLSGTLMSADLIDEYRLCLNPVVLGRGNSLFKESAGQRSFKLLEARPLKMGCVILRYEPISRS